MSRAVGPLRHRFRLLVRRAAGRAHGLPRIRQTPRRVYPEADFSLHMLVCHEDVDMALWCLKTFAHFAEISPETWIHDDGTLTAADADLFHRHIARCSVIGRADADRRLAQALSDYPRCREVRRQRRYPAVLKLFDPWVHTTRDTLLLLDSDILFFRHPAELLARASEGRACFLSDHQDAYAVAPEAIADRLGIQLLPRINAGQFVLGRADYDLGVLERYFGAFPPPASLGWNWCEQTAEAVLLSRAGAERLGRGYRISMQPITDETISHHFVNDGSRLHFSTRGLRTLQRRGMLAAFAADPMPGIPTRP